MTIDLEPIDHREPSSKLKCSEILIMNSILHYFGQTHK